MPWKGDDLMPEDPTTHSSDRPKRLTLSAILEAMLQRGGSDRSSVSLTHNAKGQTQIEVTVRTGNQHDAETVEQAMTKATLVYDSLRLRYRIEGDDAPLPIEPESEQAEELRAIAQRWLNGTPDADDAPPILAEAVVALLDQLQAERHIARAEAAEPARIEP